MACSGSCTGSCCWCLSGVYVARRESLAQPAQAPVPACSEPSAQPARGPGCCLLPLASLASPTQREGNYSSVQWTVAREPLSKANSQEPGTVQEPKEPLPHLQFPPAPLAGPGSGDVVREDMVGRGLI